MQKDEEIEYWRMGTLEAWEI